MACEWLNVLCLSFSVHRSLSLSLTLALLSQINEFITIINECTCISDCMDLRINFFLCFSLQRNGTITDFVSFYTLPSTIMHHPQHKLLKAAYSFYNVSTATPWVDLMQDALIVAKNVCVAHLKRSADSTMWLLCNLKNEMLSFWSCGFVHIFLCFSKRV